MTRQQLKGMASRAVSLGSDSYRLGGVLEQRVYRGVYSGELLRYAV